MIKFMNECTKRKRLEKERKNATVPNKLVYLKLQYSLVGWVLHYQHKWPQTNS